MSFSVYIAPFSPLFSTTIVYHLDTPLFFCGNSRCSHGEDGKHFIDKCLVVQAIDPKKNHGY